MKKILLLSWVTVVMAGSMVPLVAQEGDIHGTVGITYDTKYVWRGITVYGAKSAIHPFIDLDLMGTGFHFEVAAHRANSSGYENSERWDYTLYYANALETEQTWETQYMVGYRYFNYPDMSSSGAYKGLSDVGSVDLQEMFVGLRFPRVLGVPGLVPSYVVIKGWPSSSDTLVGGRNPSGGTYSGWAHVFMLDYALPLTNIAPEIPEQILNFHLETVYNAGVDPRPAGGYTDSDWTHVLLNVSTDFDLGNNVTFTPALNYQMTMEDDGSIGPGGYFGRGVSPDHDIFWASMTLKYKF
jgi:hypothetical protein